MQFRNERSTWLEYKVQEGVRQGGESFMSNAEDLIRHFKFKHDC